MIRNFEGMGFLLELIGEFAGNILCGISVEHLIVKSVSGSE